MKYINSCTFCSRTESSHWRILDGKLDCGLCHKTPLPSQYLFHWNTKDRVKQKPICFNCRAESSPLWRKIPQGMEDAGSSLCNACGLYLKTHSRHRPVDWKAKLSKKRKLSLEVSIESHPSPPSSAGTTPKAFSIESMLNPVDEAPLFLIRAGNTTPESPETECQSFNPAKVLHQLQGFKMDSLARVD